MDVAVVEAGLGGRLDATNVVDAESSCSPTSRWNTPRCSAKRARRSRGEARRCSCGKSRRHVGQHHSESSCPERRGDRVIGRRSREARPRRSSAGRSSTTPTSRSPGRLERRADGRDPGRRAHPGGRRLAPRALRTATTSLCVSILRDKRVDALLERLGARAARSSRRARQARVRSRPNELAARAEAHFSDVLSVADPREALAAHANLRAPRPRHRLPVPSRGSPRARGRRCR